MMMHPIYPSVAKHLHAVTGQEDLSQFSARIFKNVGHSSLSPNTLKKHEELFGPLESSQKIIFIH